MADFDSVPLIKTLKFFKILSKLFGISKNLMSFEMFFEIRNHDETWYKEMTSFYAISTPLSSLPAEQSSEEKQRTLSPLLT